MSTVENTINKILLVWFGIWVSLFLIGRELMSLHEVAFYVFIGAWGSLWLIAIYLRVVGITVIIEGSSEPEEAEG